MPCKPITSTRGDEGDDDSDSCNIGSPTAATVTGFGPFDGSDGSMGKCAPGRNEACMVYQLAGTAEGFKKYLRDAGTLQLLLVCPPAARAASKQQPAVALEGGMSEGWGAEQHPRSRSDAAVGEVAVGRVAVPLRDLAVPGETQRAQRIVVLA